MIRSKRWMSIAVLLAALTAVAALGSTAATAQEYPLGILLRAWACPDGMPADEWEECDGLVGATYRVEVDGVEIDESPVTTVRESGVGNGVFFNVPTGATTVTVTQLSGAPDGYVPAPGFDPFTADFADLTQVGMGGESTGPGITFINIPAEDGGADTGDDEGSTDDGDSGQDTEAHESEETTTLPSTGTGADEASREGMVASLLVAAMALAAIGGVVRSSAAGR